MKNISDLYPRLIPLVPGCPEPLATQALVDSAIAFCERSDAIRPVLDDITTAAGLAVYELDAPTYQSVSNVLSVTVDGKALKPVFADDFFSSPQRSGEPVVFYTTRDAGALSLNLYPTPDKAYVLKIVAATRPLRSATAVEEDLVDLWAEAVVAGAVSRIAVIPDQPFSDLSKANYYAQQSVSKAAEAKRRSSAGNLRGSMAVKSRPFA